jgi:hypothetical protein
MAWFMVMLILWPFALLPGGYCATGAGHEHLPPRVCEEGPMNVHEYPMTGVRK